MQNTIIQSTICYLTKRLPPFACIEEMEGRFPWQNIFIMEKQLITYLSSVLDFLLSLPSYSLGPARPSAGPRRIVLNMGKLLTPRLTPVGLSLDKNQLLHPPIHTVFVTDSQTDKQTAPMIYESLPWKQDPKLDYDGISEINSSCFCNKDGPSYCNNNMIHFLRYHHPWILTAY